MRYRITTQQNIGARAEKVTRELQADNTGQLNLHVWKLNCGAFLDRYMHSMDYDVQWNKSMYNNTTHSENN